MTWIFIDNRSPSGRYFFALFVKLLKKAFFQRFTFLFIVGIFSSLFPSSPFCPFACARKCLFRTFQQHLRRMNSVWGKLLSRRIKSNCNLNWSNVEWRMYSNESWIICIQNLIKIDKHLSGVSVEKFYWILKSRINSI